MNNLLTGTEGIGALRSSVSKNQGFLGKDKLIPTKRNNPCALCGNTSGNCRETDNVRLCMTHTTGYETVPGYRFAKLTKDGLWGIWVANDSDTSSAAEQDAWHKEQRVRRKLRLRAKEKQRAQALAAAERDRHYRRLLAPLDLHPIDRQDLHRRGFTDQQIAAVGFKSVGQWQRLDGQYPKNLPGVVKEGRSLNTFATGYLCPVRNQDGLIVALQVRAREGDTRYYWLTSHTQNNPEGQGPNLASGELPLSHYNGGDRPWVAFCEGVGVKPYRASNRLGCAVVGAAGGQFAGSPEQVTTALVSGKTPVLVPDGGAIANHNVMRAYRGLADLVPGLQVLWWNQRTKAEGDVDEVDAATLDQARLIPWDEFEAMAGDEGDRHIPRHQSSVTPIKGLRRRPDLNIGNQEFKDALDQYPRSGLLAFAGGTGTGKGEAIAQLVASQRWLSVTTLRSLARDQAAGWGGVFANAGDRHGDTFLKDGQPVNGGAVCIPSLLATKGIHANVLVLDELPTIQDFLLCSALANKNGLRPLLIAELERRIRDADLVMVASADLTEDALAWVEGIRGGRAYLVQSERQPLAYPCHIFLPTTQKDQAIADYLNQARAADAAGTITVFHSDSKATADRVAGALLEQGIKPLLITVDTSGGAIESAFLESKGADLPTLRLQGFGAIVTSPSVKEGFSLKYHTQLIDSVWGVFEGCSITAEAIAQTLDRVRSHTIPRYVWVAERGRAYSKLSKEETTPAFMREFRKASTTTHALARRSLLTEVDILAGGIDWDNNPHIQLLAAIETQRNQGMKALRARVETILKGRGKTIHPYTPRATLDQARAVRLRLKAIRSQQRVTRAIAIKDSPDLTEDQVKELEGVENLTPEDKLSLEKYYLRQFYRLEKVTADDVLWDGGGDRRHTIRHLEQVLKPALAMAKTAETITQNTTTPQDWGKAALQSQVLAASGAASLIRDIWAGGVVRLEQDRIEAIATWLRANPELFTQAFNFSNLSKVSDRQIAFHLLDWVGITRTSTRTRENGKVTRSYSVDQVNLKKLKALVERRSHADPSPPTIDLLAGGGSLPEFADLPLAEALDLTETWLTATTLDEKRAVLAVVEEVRGAIAA